MKKLWMMFPAMLLIAGLVLTGCDNGSTDTPAGPTGYDFTPVTLEWLDEPGAEDHKGNVEGEEFRDIKYSKPGSFLRITIKLEGNADGSYGSGKFGEVAGIDFMIPTSTPKLAEVYMDIPVADILGDIGDDADHFLVNIWNASIVSVELVETKSGARPTKPTQYTVSFDLDGGTYGPEQETELDDLKVNTGTALGTRFYSIKPLKSGVKFTGWEDSEGEVYTKTTLITANVDLTAKYESGDPETFTVSFDLDGGTAATNDGTIASIQVVDGQILADQFPSTTPVRKDGQWFTGWKDSEGTAYTASTPIEDDVELIAQWTPNTQPAITIQDPSITGFEQGARIYNDYGSVDNATGKGRIAGADLEAIRDADSDSILVIYYYNVGPTNPSGWSSVGCLESATKSADETRLDFAPTGVALNTTALSRVNIATIQDWLIPADTYINLNIWGDCIIQKIEIWTKDNTYVPPATHDFDISLPVNDTWGHQGLLAEDWLFNGGKIEEDDVYEISFTAVCSIDLDAYSLQLFFLDQSSGWATLSAQQWVSNVDTTADEPFDVSITITATGTASSNAPNANKLGFSTGAGTLTISPGAPITLEITDFTITKQD